jgi:hypothetical protein
LILGDVHLEGRQGQHADLGQRPDRRKEPSMCFVDLAVLEIRLGDVPPRSVGIGVFIRMDDEPTVRRPLGQQSLDRRRIGSL